MLRDIFVKGKEIADRMTNIVMNYTEVEAKVREATNDDAWGPHGQLMQQLAEYTFSYQTYVELMAMLWKRMYPETGKSWRRTYKSLTLLAYLLRNGSDYVASGAREHIYDLRTLESFRHLDEHGKDQGANVRAKVEEVIDLLLNQDKLNLERQKAKSSRTTYLGYSSSHTSGWGQGFNDQSPYSNDDYPNDRSSNYDPSPPPISVSKKPNSASAPANTFPTSVTADPQLGTFEDWHIGKERGVVDDVVEAVKDAWGLAKETTLEILRMNKRVAEPDEFNPRMISEEIDNRVDPKLQTTGPITSRTISSSDRSYSTTQQSDFGKPVRPKEARQNGAISSPSAQSSRPPILDFCESETGSSHSGRPPRPPSVDLVQCWDDAQDTGDGQPVDLFDPFQVHAVNSAPIQSTPPASYRTDQNGGLQTNLFDTEFGEFTRAGLSENSSQTGRGVTQNPAQPNWLANGAFPLQASTNLTWPPTAPTSSSLIPQNVAATTASSSLQPPTSGIEMPNCDTKVSPTNQNPPIGSTWKDLNIDLGSLVQTKKEINVKQPSLQQLKQQNQQQQQPFRTGNPSATAFSPRGGFSH